jgi:hypothetical protein
VVRRRQPCPWDSDQPGRRPRLCRHPPRSVPTTDRPWAGRKTASRDLFLAGQGRPPAVGAPHQHGVRPVRRMSAAGELVRKSRCCQKRIPTAL